MVTQDKDWQSEYYNLLEQQDTAESAHKEMETLFCRTLSRLAVASSGLDPSLDPHLKNLREVLRSGATPTLQQHLEQLSNDLMQVSRHTPATAEPEEDRRVPTKRSGFIGRLFGGDNKTAEKGREDQPTAVNQLLRELLERLKWPEQWKQDIESFCIHLAESTESEEWKAVIESIAVLAYHTFGAVKSEINEAEDFLEELTQRLHDLDSHLLANHTNRELTLESGRELNRFVTDQVGTIEQSLDGASDLQTLKQNIRQRLDTIQEHVETFTNEEESRYQQGEDNDLKLKQRLSELENETKELRTKMLEAHYLALQDSVTGLPNRTAYEERMGQEFIRWKRFTEPLSMLVWDIDDFKAVNDRFGHQAGDKALRVIATTLKERLRESDFIARYGGEEFVCLLCGTVQKAALSVAEEMCQSIAESGFHSGGKAVVLTASCGISTFRKGDTPIKVFARADKALYNAKRNGKNRCEVI